MCFLRIFNSSFASGWCNNADLGLSSIWEYLLSTPQRGSQDEVQRLPPRLGKHQREFIGFGVIFQHGIEFHESLTVAGSSNGLRTWGPRFHVSCPSG